MDLDTIPFSDKMKDLGCKYPDDYDSKEIAKTQTLCCHLTDTKITAVALFCIYVLQSIVLVIMVGDIGYLSNFILLFHH